MKMSRMACLSHAALFMGLLLGSSISYALCTFQLTVKNSGQEAFRSTCKNPAPTYLSGTCFPVDTSISKLCQPHVLQPGQSDQYVFGCLTQGGMTLDITKENGQGQHGVIFIGGSAGGSPGSEKCFPNAIIYSGEGFISIDKSALPEIGVSIHELK